MKRARKRGSSGQCGDGSPTERPAGQAPIQTPRRGRKGPGKRENAPAGGENAPTRVSARHARVRAPLIIGYGNSLRGDDAVGPRLAEKLGGIAVQQLLPELAERLAGEESVVFVDARTDLAPGEVRIMPLDGEGASTHWCSPGSLLRLARVTYGHAPEAVLVGIGARSFDFGAPLSTAARQGMKKALAEIGRLIKSCRSGAGSR